jgi:UDP-glucose 4-epimerase
MKIFVTGGAGFIGSWVVRVLLAEGHDVTVFDNLSTGYADQVPEKAVLVVGDLRNKNEIFEPLRGHDAVIHLAAKSLVTESVRDPQGTFETNLGGGQNLLEAMRELDVRKIVYSSSASVYGTPRRIPITEEDPTWPISPYGASKRAFEEILSAYHANYGFDVVCFRYFNPYGPGERHEPESHAIPNFIRACLRDEPVTLYWNGEQKRDFFYVEDIAKAHVMGLAQSGFDYFNLGSGGSIRVREVVDIVARLVGVTPKIEDKGERPGDPPELLADTGKAARVLGWHPTTPLEDGLRVTVEEFRHRYSQK